MDQMASIRPRRDPGAVSGDATSRRVGGYTASFREDHPSTLTRRTRQETETPRYTPAYQPAPQSKATSRIPQTASQRRLSVQGQLERPAPGPQTQLRGSGTSGSSASSTSTTTTPSTVSSGARTQTTMGPNQSRGVLRQKQPLMSHENPSVRVDSRSGSHRTSSSTSSIPQSFEAPSSQLQDRFFTESPADFRTAYRGDLPTPSDQTVTIYPELDRYREYMPPMTSESPAFGLPPRLATHDLPPPTPLFSGASSQVSGLSGSPSTRFSESPGAGPYSRDTTPTSISSQSPGLMAPFRMGTSRTRQMSPAQTRPPVSRRRAGSTSNEAEPVNSDIRGLSVVREALTSSSSNSTVLESEKKREKEKKTKTKGLLPVPPNPPPRKSSQKFRKGEDDEEDESPSKKSSTDRAAQPRPISPQPNMVASPNRTQAVTSPKPATPRRPSRDGTPDLHRQFGLPVPVVHSNLSSSSLPDRRQSATLQPRTLNRSVTPSSMNDRPQPSRLAAPTAATWQKEQRPAKPETSKAARSPSPNVSTFKSRFPLFGRRTKTAPAVPQVEKAEKPARKGPAAGTGHEGYGKLGSARRRSSSSTNLARGLPGTMSSQESLGTSDPFLLERVNPVVISGGEIVENRNTSSELSRTESNQSFHVRGPSFESKNSSQISLSSREGGRRTLWPSPFARNAGTSTSRHSRHPSDSSDSDALAMRSTLAFRRSVQKLNADDQAPLRLPKPIMTKPNGIMSPSAQSLDTGGILSDDSALNVSKDAARGRKDKEAGLTKKLTKRARSPRKWNFFGRSHTQQPPAPKKQPEAKTVAATVKAVQSKPVAFYTMMDASEQEDGDVPDLEEVLREAHVLESPPPMLPPPQQLRPRFQRAASRDRQAVVSPVAAPAAAPAQTARRTPNIASPPPPRATPEPSPSPQPQAQRSGRPSRLPQVGRIPKVVSARPEPDLPKSFSRPFHRLSVQTPPLQSYAPDAEFLAKGPSPPSLSTPDLTHDESTVTSGTNNSDTHYRTSKEFTPDNVRVTREFLSFSPRENSLCTMTTSSSGSGPAPYAHAPAVIPEANAPLAEDEIWDEYNDLLADESMKVPPSAGSSMGMPFHLEGYGARLNKQIEKPLESPTINMHLQPKSVGDIARDLRPAASSVYSADMTAKVKEALDTAQIPSTPFSVTDFVSGYEDRNNSVESKRPGRPQRTSQSPTAMARVRESGLSECSQESDDSSPLSQVNLRVGSMTVSKWLTFGHVLFSPMRDDLVPAVGSLNRHSILVIDGLGNDDWSFYAAETYPAATFFNLSPRAPLPESHQSSNAFPLSPPNHHQIQYFSHIDKFPFGAQSFMAVVYRFPTAAPESHYRNIVSEARRVLKPGGYLELSILDVDLNNMGIRARRNVRRLKERIHSCAPDTSIASTSDLMLRLLGRKGFADIKTCRVGVPVASAIASSAASAAICGSPSSNSGRKQQVKGRKPKDDRSLAEMMSDESPVADESITKMVAKVGRWWYSRCYESAATATSSAESAAASAGVWNDKGLLGECEEWGTSLKLMVCHARVSDGQGSRVASI